MLVHRRAQSWLMADTELGVDFEVTTKTRELRCSAPAVTSAAEFTRWTRRRVKFTSLPSSPLVGARAAVKVLLAAPVRSVELTASPSGERIGDYLRPRQRGPRSRVYAQSVLSIPP